MYNEHDYAKHPHAPDSSLADMTAAVVRMLKPAGDNTAYGLDDINTLVYLRIRHNRAWHKADNTALEMLCRMNTPSNRMAIAHAIATAVVSQIGDAPADKHIAAITRWWHDLRTAAVDTANPDCQPADNALL